MTYGTIRGRLAKLAPGVDIELLDGWIADRYTDILDKLPWRRTRQQTVIQLVAEYNTGTVAVTKGSSAVTGTLTVWTSAMTGRMFRVDGDNAYYEFTYVSTTSGTLDRTYEGANATAAGYSINQSIYQLPTTCRYVEEARLLDPARELVKKSQAEMTFMSPNRNTYGGPGFYAPFMDDASDPPRGQIEFYPVPEDLSSVALWFVAEQADLGATATTMLPWMRPGALVAGVQADIARHVHKNIALAQSYELQYSQLVQNMIRTNAEEQGPQRIRLAAHMTRTFRKRGFQ